MLTRRQLLAAPLLQAGRGFTFAIVGDRTGSARPGVYEQVWQEIAAARPDFAINVGDTIEGGIDVAAPQEWDAVRVVWSKAGIPFHLVAGNHDIWSAGSRRLFEREAGGPARRSFTYGGALFVLLDNAQTEQLAQAELDFLDRELTRHAALRPKFVFFHKPFWLVYLKVGSGEFDLHRICRKHQVDFVVSGHGHQFLQMARDGIRYLQIGSSGGSFTHGKALAVSFGEGFFYHYAIARVRGAKAEIEIRELGRPFGEGRRINCCSGPG